MTSERTYTALLASDGWRPLSEYVPSRDYVYVRGYGYDTWNPGAAMARRGRHPLSDWWNPAGQLLHIDVQEWKPFPNDGMSPHERWLAFSTNPNDNSFVRPPEPVYEPGGIRVRLTPVPRLLLLEMRDGARLHESAWRWTEWRLQRPGREMERIAERGINPLRKVAFIARYGVLPVGRLPYWHEFEWFVTDAGKAWIEVNAKPAASAAAQPQETTCPTTPRREQRPLRPRYRMLPQTSLLQ
jgi:hypothetical protein